eukprot:scaffold33469_cov24-Attheya_sp.AAC.1
MQFAVAEELFGSNSQVKVVFSCGGTGAIRSTVGSLPSNFKFWEMTMTDVVESMFNDSLNGLELIFPDRYLRTVNEANVMADLPIVHQLLTNGRMNSIAVAQLTKWEKSRKINE